MRTTPLPADFIYARTCKLKCEKFLTRPNKKYMNMKHLEAAIEDDSIAG